MISLVEFSKVLMVIEAYLQTGKVRSAVLLGTSMTRESPSRFAVFVL